MRFTNTEVWGFEHGLRGMRNPMNSWDKSDTTKIYWNSEWHTEDEKLRSYFHDFGVNELIGKNDMGLAQKLIKAGGSHRKFMRQIFVSVDITAPLYWWKEFDTYKVGTVANSTSTMHKLATTPITLKCFETDDLNDIIVMDGKFIYEVSTTWKELIESLEGLRLTHLETKDKRLWKELVRLLPESYLQKRTVTMSYENILNMVRQRKNHKLNEWSGGDNPELPNFISWARTLPYAQELIFIDESKGLNKERG